MSQPSEASPAVRELRLVVTAADYEQALHFYRDVLGLPERAAFASPDGRVTILEAGRATPEIADPGHADFIDEVEVGRRVAGHLRVAFRVADSAAATAELATTGAEVIAEPVRTPWNSLNSRLEAPGAPVHPLHRTRRPGHGVTSGRAGVNPFRGSPPLMNGFGEDRGGRGGCDDGLGGCGGRCAAGRGVQRDGAAEVGAAAWLRCGSGRGVRW